jgi:hypothetical protein
MKQSRMDLFEGGEWYGKRFKNHTDEVCDIALRNQLEDTFGCCLNLIVANQGILENPDAQEGDYVCHIKGCRVPMAFVVGMPVLTMKLRFIRLSVEHILLSGRVLGEPRSSQRFCIKISVLYDSAFLGYCLFQFKISRLSEFHLQIITF